MNNCIEIRKLNSRFSAQEDIRVLKTVYDASPNYFKTVIGVEVVQCSVKNG